MLLVNAVNTEGRPLEIFVKDGRIAAVGQELEALAGDNETVVDAGGLTVLPAFVDLHCHWRTPGFEFNALIALSTSSGFFFTDSFKDASASSALLNFVSVFRIS